ncbi:hypothetical protein [Chitinolyticbacter albus]|uniref:hypothetical protein n=1 Tax=Chitinolyticbacter albus TaxID=2961951 RepID=UPI00210A2AF5|nr:hypothetical protein [Chitinolyticbacter albus]
MQGIVPQILVLAFSPLCQAPKERSETLGSRPTEGSPEGRKAGSPFLWFVSFGEAKEMNPSAGRNRHKNTVLKAQKHKDKTLH